MGRLLIIDDDAAVLTFLAEELSAYHDVVVELSPRAGLARIERTDFDLVIADLEMPEMHGTELLQAIFATKPDQPVLVITRFRSPDLALQAIRDGARDVLTKPFSVAALRAAIERSGKSSERRRDSALG